MSMTIVATVEQELAVAVARESAVRTNKLMRVSISSTASEALRAKIATVQEMDEDGWELAEIALALEISKTWAAMLRRDVTYFFYCGTCGAQVATKHAECRQCN